MAMKPPIFRYTVGRMGRRLYNTGLLPVISLAWALLPGFLPVCLVLLAAPAWAAEPVLRLARVLPDSPSYQCMAASEYALGGLRLGDPLARLGSTMGVPRTLSTGYGEDDGGGYRAYTYDYGGLKVEVVRGVVDVIHAYGARFATPSGLRVGMSRDEAIAILGREPDPENLNEGVYSFSGCPETRDGKQLWYDSWYFEFAFGVDGRLSLIRFVTDRP